MATLEAGRDLDALVAEKVMGLPRQRWGDCGGLLTTPVYNSPIVRCSECRLEVPWNDPEAARRRGRHDGLPPKFSTDIAAAWQVVEKMRADEHGWELWLPNSGGFWEQAKVYNGSQEWIGKGMSMPEAICRAALAALEAANPDTPRVQSSC